MKTILLLVALGASTAYDGAATAHCLGRGATERNPLFGARPSGVKITLALTALTAADGAFLWHLHRKHPKLSQSILAAGSAAHVAAATHNLETCK